uniref:Uncharacterized protein n=1 Tax=Zygnema circumcarinatum TaxID=35869 RepID=A0A6N0GXK6_ZYGCR|nr:hypothetical protein P8547_mgp30 [Zygnema circumcarinatum]QKQ14710.1 hypothetical protein [Zygnema circumcarinatum]WEL36353.1 hypothetical protein [Zygnema circumcarinatum]
MASVRLGLTATIVRTRRNKVSLRGVFRLRLTYLWFSPFSLSWTLALNQSGFSTEFIETLPAMRATRGRP